jgi:hypothetical protein
VNWEDVYFYDQDPGSDVHRAGAADLCRRADLRQRDGWLHLDWRQPGGGRGGQTGQDVGQPVPPGKRGESLG